MSRSCLDTSAHGQFRRGHQAVVGLIASASWLGVPAIVLGEFRSGFLLGDRAELRGARDFIVGRHGRMLARMSHRAASESVANAGRSLEHDRCPVACAGDDLTAGGRRDAVDSELVDAARSPAVPPRLVSAW